MKPQDKHPHLIEIKEAVNLGRSIVKCARGYEMCATWENCRVCYLYFPLLNVQCKWGDVKLSIKGNLNHMVIYAEKNRVHMNYTWMANSNLDSAISSKRDRYDRPMTNIFIYDCQSKELYKVKNFSNKYPWSHHNRTLISFKLHLKKLSNNFLEAISNIFSSIIMERKVIMSMNLFIYFNFVYPRS